MKRNSLLSVWIIALVMTTGCAGVSSQPPTPPIDPQVKKERSAESFCGGQAWNLNFSPLLPAEAWEIVLGFLDENFTAEAALEEGEFNEWFALGTPQGYEAYALHKLYRSCLMKIRRLRPHDLSLASWEYDLGCLEVWEEEGGITAIFQENSHRQFAFAPQVTAGCCELHQFHLVKTAMGWKIGSYRPQQGFGNAIVEDYSTRKANRGIQGYGTSQQVEQIISDMEREYLEQGEKDVLLTAQSLADDQREVNLERGIGHPYNREDALAYARAWAYGGAARLRSRAWPVYDDYGGDCQNFVSQCLFAGGIPMDWAGKAQWKWLGHTPNLRDEGWGRSPSWSGVKEFYAYCQENEDWGLAAWVDAPLGHLRPGDVLQFAALDDWRHSVLITGEVRDAQGIRVDWLVASHCADQENWPLSAYSYSTVRGITILGWNG